MNCPVLALNYSNKINKKFEITEEKSRFIIDKNDETVFVAFILYQFDPCYLSVLLLFYFATIEKNVQDRNSFLFNLEQDYGKTETGYKDKVFYEAMARTTRKT